MTNLEDWRTHAEKVIDLYKRCMFARSPEEFDRVRLEMRNIIPPSMPNVKYIEFEDAVTILYLQPLVSALHEATLTALRTLEGYNEDSSS